MVNKIEALLRKEKLWEITENKIVPRQSLTTVGNQTNVSESMLAEDKATVIDAIISSIKDDIIHDIAKLDVAANAWAKLKQLFESEDPLQILLVSSQIHSMSKKEGGSM